MDWRDLARRQGGAITREQLLRSGESRDAVDGLVRRHEVVELLPGVYSPRPVPDSAWQRLWAASLWSGGVISHRSAAPLWAVSVSSEPTVHVTVGDLRFRRAALGIRVHRVHLSGAEQATIAGLPVTSRARTVIDLLRTERPANAIGLFDRASQLGWIDERTVRASVSAQLGRTGNVQLRMLLAAIEPGAEAESERRLHSILRRAGLTGWVAQYRIRLPTGVAIADVAFPAQRLVIEVDGRRYHDASDRFESDRRRQNGLIAMGWRVLRFTWRMLIDQPDQVTAQIVQLLAA